MPDQPSELTVLDALPVHPGDAPDPSTWRLRVDGLVGEPLNLGVDDLLAMTQQLMVDDFACLEGWTVPGIRWRGVAVADLLDRASVPSEAAWVQVTADDFSIPLPLAEARTAILAIEANDEPLAGPHGGPARLVVPGGECFTSIKWTDHIEVRSEPGDNSARRIALDRLGGGDQ
ncbi:MAG: molybdopterin-dependent oxidoreductase [Chloroflexi bacterium]|nr:molybdopterin-dependent oxidoreductase [Chloroflexota bacterium]